MKLIIQNDNGENIYERDAHLYECSDILKCKDCANFIQHYALTDIPNKDGCIAKHCKKIGFLTELGVGHCTAKPQCKTVNNTGRICNKFVLGAEQNNL